MKKTILDKTQPHSFLVPRPARSNKVRATKSQHEGEPSHPTRPRFEVDLTLEVDDGPPFKPKYRPTNPQYKREVTRGFIAGALIVLVALMALGAFALLLAGYSIGTIQQLFALVFTPVIALTGGVCGYYFGTHRSTA